MNTSDSRRHDICSKSCPKRRARHCGRKKSEILKQQDRLQKIPPQLREQELDELVIQSLAKNEVPPYEKWCLRQRAQQAMLPFCVSPEDGVDLACSEPERLRAQFFKEKFARFSTAF